MSTDPGIVLRLALGRDAEATMAALGISAGASNTVGHPVGR